MPLKPVNRIAGRHWKFAVILGLIVVLAVLFISWRWHDRILHLTERLSVKDTAANNTEPPNGQLSEKNQTVQGVVVSEPKYKKEVFPRDGTGEEAYYVDAVAERRTKMDRPPRVNDKYNWKTVIIKKGDSFSKLVAHVYGQYDRDILKMVHKDNPEIKDINVLEVGQKIIFPPPYKDVSRAVLR